MSGVLTYSANNSGGNWWLNDDDWRHLEDAGWQVEWVRNQTSPLRAGERFLGALATEARKTFDTPEEGVAEWAEITKANPAALGCYSCCGPPHSFDFRAEGEPVRYISPTAPYAGEMDYDAHTEL